MKSFSKAGMANKGFFGYGAKTFGNPLGAITGNGGTSGAGSNPPGPPPPPPTTIVLTVGQDFIDTGTPMTGAAVTLSQLLTAAGRLTDWESGLFNAINLSADTTVPARGYYVIAGNNQAGNFGYVGLDIDVLPAVDVTLNLDLSQIRIYGGGGSGATLNFGFDGGNAIAVTAGTGNLCDVNVTLQSIPLASTGRVYGGGGGGGGAAVGGQRCGCGASGWSPGLYGSAPTNPGGIYDPDNGGTGIAGVPGSAAITPQCGNGGPLGGGGATAMPSGHIGGAGGFALNRFAVPGTTVFDTTDSDFVRGAIT